MILTEAAIIAFAHAVEAVAVTARVAMEGQTPEQRAKLWQWYIDDVAALRKMFGMSA